MTSTTVRADRQLRDRMRRMAPAAAGTLAVAWILALGLESVPATRVNTDSFRYLMSAETLERTGDLTAVAYLDLSKRLLGTPLLHTLGSATARGYVASITPILGLSGLAVMTWLCSEAFRIHRTPRVWRRVLLVAAFAMLLSTNRFVFAMFYINGHMLSATLYLVGIGAAWLGATRRDNGLLIPAGMAFAALVCVRPESTIVATAMLLPFFVPGRLTHRGLWLLISPFVVACLLWHGLAYPALAGTADPSVLGPARGPAFLGLALLFLASIRTTRMGHRLAHRGSAIASIAIIGYLSLSAILQPTIMIDSVNAIAVNLSTHGLWGFTWMITIPLLIITARVATFRFSHLWTHAISAFALTLLVLPYLRDLAYRPGWYDSGNRMTIHVILLATTYLVIAAASVVRAAHVHQGVVIDLAEIEREHRQDAQPELPTHGVRQPEPQLRAPAGAPDQLVGAEPPHASVIAP